MYYTDFARSLKDRKADAPALPAVLLLFGAEDFLKRAAIEQIRVALGLQEREVRFDGEEVEPDQVINEVFTLSFFSAGVKLTVVDRAESFFSDYEKSLKKAFAVLPVNSVLVLLAGKLPSNSKLLKWAGQVGQSVECAALDEHDRVSWIQSRARQGGKPIAPEAAKLLAHKVDGGMHMLAGHLENLTLYARERKEIGRADVEALVGADRSYVVFDLVKAVKARRRPEALQMLHALLRDVDGIESILGALAWQFRQLLQADLSLRAGVPRARVSERLRLRGMWEDEFYRTLGQFPAGELRRKHRLLGRFDLMAKTSAMPGDVLAELLVLQLMEA